VAKILFVNKVSQMHFSVSVEIKMDMILQSCMQ
jgi:hypothetical protein